MFKPPKKCLGFFSENKICDCNQKGHVFFLFEVLFVAIPRVVWKGLKMGGKSGIGQRLYLWHSSFLRSLTLPSYKIMFYVPQSWWESGRISTQLEPTTNQKSRSEVEAKKTSQNVVMLTLFHAIVHLGGHPGYLRRAISHIRITPEISERLKTLRLLNNISPSLPVCGSPSVHK